MARRIPGPRGPAGGGGTTGPTGPTGATGPAGSSPALIFLQKSDAELVFANNGLPEEFSPLVSGVAGDFALSDPTGSFTLGTLGRLTYAGAPVIALLACSVTFAYSVTSLVAFAYALNGDLFGQNAAVGIPLGAQFFTASTSNSSENLVSYRRVSLTNGDVIQPVGCTVDASDDLILSALSLRIELH